jgi:GNAT superfamily N-acetyltransferase
MGAIVIEAIKETILEEKIIGLTEENIAGEHICCGFSDKKCQQGYELKKQWLKAQLAEGYTFKKLNVRGKVFIEYCPAEKGWLPIEANGYMLINCFWVSGQYKGKGHGKALLQECEKDAMAQGMKGLVAVSAKKKQPFMSDMKFFLKQGFTACDSAEPYFELLYKPFSDDAEAPKFKSIAKKGVCDVPEGLALYYTNACPFTDFYVSELMKIAADKGYKLQIFHLDSREKAQNHIVPHTIYTIFQDGKFVTQHILNENYFGKFIQ